MLPRSLATFMLVALAGSSIALAQPVPVTGISGFNQVGEVPVTLLGRDPGVLTITTGAASDSFTLFVGEQGPGTVVLNAVPGVPDGTLFINITRIVISTGGGNDMVEVFATGESFPPVSIDLGTGQNEVVAQYNATFGALSPTAELVVTGNTGADKVNATINSDANGFTSNFNFNLGEGFNDTFVQWVSQSPGEDILNLRVRGGASVDTLGLAIEGLTSDPIINLDAALGGGIDNVTVDAKSAPSGQISANFAMDLGLGNDTATFNFAEADTTRLSGSILGGGGSDVIELSMNRDLAGAFTIDSGAGNDLIKVVAGNAIFGAPRLLAAAGNDNVELSGVLGLGATPFSDGGAGFDAFKGVPVFVNFEQIN